MPSDAKHIKVGTVVCGLLMLPLIHFGVDYVLIAVFAASYIFTTRFLSPDIDLDSKPYHRWGPLRYLLYIYMHTHTHRKSSHSFIKGPIIALLYFCVVVVLPLLVILYMLVPITCAVMQGAVHVAELVTAYVYAIEPTHENLVVVGVAVAAFVLSRWTHSVLDIVAKEDKKA